LQHGRAVLPEQQTLDAKSPSDGVKLLDLTRAMGILLCR
jgi:hypothetical protein